MSKKAFTAEDLKLLKQNMRERYNSIKTPHTCKVLNRKVVLNSRGFHHLLYDSSGKARTILAARNRLLQIPYIAPVLLSANDSSYEKKYARKNRKKDSPSVQVEQWGLEATLKNEKIIRVILRRENGGQIIFWSVMRVK